MRLSSLGFVLGFVLAGVLAGVLAACATHHAGDPAPDARDLPADAMTCGGQTLDLTYVPPNLGIVLDRSCSMKKVLSGTQTTKWQAAVAALDHVLASYPSDVRWGLTLFPDTTGASCAQDASTIAIGDGQAPGIQAVLDASLGAADPNYPAGPCVTNIDTGIEGAALDPALAAPGHASYLMLVTDGAQSSGCDLGGGDAGSEQAIDDLFTQRHIATFVVGFGSQADTAELTRLATRGGVPASGATPYYQADTAADLDAVFQQIANQVVSCTYQVSQTPPDLDQTYVIYGTTELVPHDTAHGAGWDYDPATMTLTLYGSYCDRLKDHSVTAIDVVFGCPAPPIL